MKQIELKAFREKGRSDQLAELVNLKRSGFNLRLMRANQGLTDTSSLKKNKKSIAQVQTLLSEINRAK